MQFDSLKETVTIYEETEKFQKNFVTKISLVLKIEKKQKLAKQCFVGPISGKQEICEN